MCGFLEALKRIFSLEDPKPILCSPSSPVDVVGSQFVKQYPTKLVITRKLSLTDRYFEVTDGFRNLDFTVKAPFMSLGLDRVLYDASGVPLVTIRCKVFSAYNRWEVFRGESSDSRDIIFSVQKSSVFQVSTELHVFLRWNTQESFPNYRIKESFLGLSCTVDLGDDTIAIAQMKKLFRFPEAMVEDTYEVTMSSKVDRAFIAALIVVLHEMNHKNGRR